MEYKVDTCGLVISLVDNQSEMSSEELFKEEFEKDIFSGYKKDVEKYSNKIDKALYNPVGYHLFGDFNMAVVSLIDDFAFPNRVLHTGHEYSSDQDNKRKYTLQIINGVHSWIDNTSLESRTLKQLAASTFLKKEERFPFIGIVNYKINNGLLIGDGTGLLEMIKQKLYLLKEEKTGSHPFELICIDSFSNNELVAIYFATELSTITSFTNETRTLKLFDLAKVEDKKTNSIVNKIARNSLLFATLNKKTSRKERLAIVKDAHIFSTSFTHLGYDMTLAECLPPTEEKLIFQYQWDLKPGHYHDFKREVINEKKIFGTNVEERIMAGIDMLQLVVKKETFIKYRNRFCKLRNNTKICEYIRKQRINVVFSNDCTPDEAQNDANHPEFMKRLSLFSFDHTILNGLREDLDACRVSKVLTERTLKMYATFNDCITDLLFFNYFIELKGYLEGIRNRIHEYRNAVSEETSLEDFHTWLNRMIRNFEQAYNNRFHHSSRMRNIFDFNLEYNGGIQQLISAYDTAYKTILKRLEINEADDNCVYVSGYERVSSDRASLRINISHITYPELYAATIWKEAMNFYWSGSEYTKPENFAQINLFQNNQLLSADAKIRMLRNNILHNKAYKPSSYVHRLLLGSVNSLFIHYLMADHFVFKIGYMSNFQTFTFWYWHYFSQMSHFYTHEGEMLPEVFVKFQVRWLFVKRFWMADKADILQEDYVAFDPKLSELWHCYTHDTNTFIDILLDEFRKYDFLAEIKSEAVLFDYKLLKLDNIHNEEFTEQNTQLIKELLESWRSELDKQSKAFKDGNIIILDREKTTDFLFIRNLMFNYLKIISGLDLPEKKEEEKKSEGKEEKSIHILERGKDGKIIKREHYYPVLSDPLGGMFISDNNKREEYFKFRSVFYKSLWGAGLQIKKDNLRPYFSEEKKPNV